MKKITALLVTCLSIGHFSFGQIKYANDLIKTGAEQTEKYVHLLKGKRVAIVANPTSIIGNTHLVDSLLQLKINVVKVFGLEHGFRGNASNGTPVKDEIDPMGFHIISLYGKKRKPSAEDLSDVDIVVFDIQDVGCRFYTNINAMRNIMESCARNDKELLILDRPNPNAYLIDGPILDMRLKSGIGQFPVPISHGLTMAEFAQMINGEHWLPHKLKCKLSIVKVKNYNHDMMYKLPVDPSPNLNTEASILLYPSTCLFEGVALNHGRGTDYPFTVIGGPVLNGIYDFSFTPVSKKGMSERPLYMNEVCYGIDLRGIDLEKLVKNKKIELKWIIELYKKHPDKEHFFDRSISDQIGNIDYLAGNYEFKKQIENAVPEEEIRKSWKAGLKKYKEMRKNYLLYP